MTGTLDVDGYPVVHFHRIVSNLELAFHLIFTIFTKIYNGSPKNGTSNVHRQHVAPSDIAESF